MQCMERRPLFGLKIVEMALEAENWFCLFSSLDGMKIFGRGKKEQS